MSDADSTRPDGPDTGSSAQTDQTPGQTSPRPPRSNPDQPTGQPGDHSGRSVEWNGEVHPLATSYPDIKGDPFDELAADIKHNGLVRPIMLDQNGTLIDGRQRLRACQTAGVTPTFAVLPAGEDVVAYIVSANQHRRHLTANQRTAAALEIKRILDQREPRKVGRPKKSSKRAETTRRGGQISRHQNTNAGRAAAATGASESSVYKLEALQEKAPDLAEEVKRDEKSLSAATREAKTRTSATVKTGTATAGQPSHVEVVEQKVTIASSSSETAVFKAQVFLKLWQQIAPDLDPGDAELLGTRAHEAASAWAAVLREVTVTTEPGAADPEQAPHQRTGGDANADRSGGAVGDSRSPG